MKDEVKWDLAFINAGGTSDNECCPACGNECEVKWDGKSNCTHCGEENILPCRECQDICNDYQEDRVNECTHTPLGGCIPFPAKGEERPPCIKFHNPFYLKDAMTAITVDHTNKKIHFHTKTDSCTVNFHEYDEWNTIELNEIKVDLHFLWDEELVLYLSALDEAEDGTLSNSQTLIDAPCHWKMDHPIVSQVGKLPPPYGDMQDWMIPVEVTETNGQQVFKVSANSATEALALFIDNGGELVETAIEVVSLATDNISVDDIYTEDTDDV